MQLSQVVSPRTLDELEEALISLSTRINTAEYDFLVLVREFDLRHGWKEGGYNNCAEWLNFKCGICPGTAREKVRVSRALFDLPLVSAAFQSGELSYSKARSVTRIATPENEEELVTYAVRATAQQVDEHCRRRRNVQPESLADARRLHRERYLSRTVHSDGRMTLSMEVPIEQGELLMKAVDRALAEMEAESEVEDEETFHQRQADALVEVARGYLSGGANKGSCTADHYQVVVRVDEKALRGAAGTGSCTSRTTELLQLSWVHS